MLLLLSQAEHDLKVAQEEYDRQAEITKLLMEGVPSAHPQHLQHLLDFVDTQAAFYLKCHESLMSLQSDLSGQVKKNQLTLSKLQNKF